MAAAYGARKLRGAFKQYANRRRMPLRRNKRRGPAMGGSVVPTNMGRSMIRIPRNLPKKLKTGLKHCRTLTKKKIELFKDALKKTVNQIFYYRGHYMAIELGISDNVDRVPGVFKTQPTVNFYGGGIGFGRRAPDFSTVNDTCRSYELENGNNLAICLDMPTGDFLPSNFVGDFDDGTGFDNRIFAMHNFSTRWNQKKLTALNLNEKDDKNNPVVNALATQTQSLTYQKIYTLSYKYTFSFKAQNCQPMTVWVITFKLTNSKPNDFPFGLSNYLNTQVQENRSGTHKRLLRGEMPPCFRVVKKKKLTLIDDVSNDNPYMTNYGGKTKTATCTITSPNAYLACATRPSDFESASVFTQPAANWYDENTHKYTYLLVYAVPTVLTQYQATPAAGGNLGPNNRVSCLIEKETSYCVLTR